jgi:predicted nucleotidyltransferase
VPIRVNPWLNSPEPAPSIYTLGTVSHSASPRSVIPSRVQAYIETIVHSCADDGRALVSVVLFGSAAIGGWTETVSDVDLILVVPDSATDDATTRLRSEAERIEILHQFRSPSGHRQPALEKLLDRVTAHDRTFFICTRGDLLSGNIGRILRLHPSQTIFVDRIVLANFVASGITVWGQALLPLVPVAPIRRFDVFKAFFGQFPLLLLCAAIFPLHPAMTRYAMGVLKGSVHSCFFCYERRRAPLEDEIGFFERRLGSNRALVQLLALRREYRTSFAFVLRCIPTMMRLHFRTAVDNRFPGLQSRS